VAVADTEDITTPTAENHAEPNTEVLTGEDPLAGADAPTFTKRIEEALEKGYAMDIAVVVWGIVNAFFMLVVKRTNAKETSFLKNTLNQTTDASNRKTNELIKATNAVDGSVQALAKMMDDFMPQFEQALKEARTVDSERIEALEKQMARIGTATVMFAEMLRTIYSGSRTIPQPTKDLVNANYLKVVNAFTETETSNEDSQ
jgi:hypothetical protein